MISLPNTTDHPGVVIIGAGIAASESCMALRHYGYTGRITVVGEERYPPYQRPPLSKSFLLGNIGVDALYAKPATAYDKSEIRVICGTRAAKIDVSSKSVSLANAQRIEYSALILAVGGRARNISSVVPGLADAAPNLHSVRTIDDVNRLRGQLVSGKRLVIIGAGYLGLELASVGIKLGLRVCVLESQSRVLARVTAPDVSRFFEDVHRQAGVDLRTAAEIRAFEHSSSDGSIETIVCSSGVIPADVVVACVGMVPNTELARDAGIAVDDGIVVDADGRTSEGDVFAIGDCASAPFRHGQRIRLESVPNALEQARAAAACICGKARGEPTVPWFWSDQYDLKLQIAGVSRGYESAVVRGSMSERRFSVLYLKDDLLIAADTINCPSDFNGARTLISRRRPVDARLAADASLPLTSLA